MSDTGSLPGECLVAASAAKRLRGNPDGVGGGCWGLLRSHPPSAPAIEALPGSLVEAIVDGGGRRQDVVRWTGVRGLSAGEAAVDDGRHERVVDRLAGEPATVEERPEQRGDDRWDVRVGR
jgi:hypothetical protein